MSETRLQKISEELKGLPALCVRRPVFAVVLNLLIILAGLAAMFAVEIRELPSIDRPVVTIRTTYSGATPETAGVTPALPDDWGAHASRVSSSASRRGALGVQIHG